jgi:hypothetical protein
MYVLLGNSSIKTLLGQRIHTQQQKHFNDTRVISKERRRLVLPRTFFFFALQVTLVSGELAKDWENSVYTNILRRVAKIRELYVCMYV